MPEERTTSLSDKILAGSGKDPDRKVVSAIMRRKKPVGQGDRTRTSPPMSEFTPREIKHLELFSRAYRKAVEDIDTAIRQELRYATTPEERTEVGLRFGLNEAELNPYLPENILRYRGTVADRAHLHSPEEVYEHVLRHITLGRLKPGDQFPPRTAFIKTYQCCKRTHLEVVDRLLAQEVIHRPGGKGGPFYIL